ncbi:hypothetical protein SH501x_003707 [Pirellulaceae bacterium SH501]
MSKAKFTIEEFKVTFKKPTPPNGFSGSDKDDMEKSVKKLTGSASDSVAEAALRDKTSSAYKNHPAYFVELLCYKLSKHWDKGQRDLWMKYAPPEAVADAFQKICEGKVFDEKSMLEMLEEYQSFEAIGLYFWKNHKDLLTSVAKKKCGELAGKDLKEFVALLPADLRKELLTDAMEKQNAEVVLHCSSEFFFLPIQDQMEHAKKDLDFFIKNIFIPAHSNTDNALNILKNPQWRAILQQDPLVWGEIAKTMPIVAVGVAAQKRLDKDPPEPMDLANAIFNCVCENDGVSMTYFTNPLDTDHALLGGPGEKDTEAKKEQIKKLEEQGYDIPDKPATQCHNLKGVVKQMLQLALGSKVTIEEDHIQHMLLTCPLSEVPGGLLPNTFKGNVCDDSGNFTGQVMFTGVGGTHSHTWLKVNGVDFDPVLGTRGPEVKKSKADEFKWVVPDLLAKGEKGSFIIKDPTLRAAPNKHGFDSAYRLTDSPDKYLQPIFGVTLELVQDQVKVKEVFAKGPAANVLEVNDVILKVDKTPPDPSKLSSYNFGSADQKRVFEIKRGAKKKKYSIKPVDPLGLAT